MLSWNGTKAGLAVLFILMLVLVGAAQPRVQAQILPTDPLDDFGEIVSEVVTNEEVPVAGTYQNTCNGDTIAVEGFARVESRTQTSKSGNMRVIFRFDFKDHSAVGVPSGLRYNTTQRDMTHIHIQNPLPQIHHQDQRVHLVNESSADNLWHRIMFHHTINSNGNVTSSTSKVELAECRG